MKNKNYSFIGFNNYEGGYVTGINLLNKLSEDIKENKKLKILLIEGYPFGTSPQRVKGFQDAIGNNALIKKIKGEFQQSVSYSKSLKFLEKEHVDAIFATNDTMAIGALNATKSLGLKIPICGFDMTEEGLKAIEQKEFLSTINTKPHFLGELAAKQIIDLLYKKNAPKKTEYDIELVSS
jgi:ribose transport system substrate-binding protein